MTLHCLNLRKILRINLLGTTENIIFSDSNLWKCSKCLNLNSTNISCFKCGEKRKDGLQLELDDEQNKQSLNEAYNWICQSCGYMHFKDKLRCLNCNLPKRIN